MLQEELTEPTNTEWAGLIVSAPKKGGSLRLFVGYPKLKVVAVRSLNLLAEMDEFIDSLVDARIFSTLDTNSGYSQTEIYERDRPKTALLRHYRLLQYERMSFGLKNAPATFP